MEIILIRHSEPDYSKLNENDNTKLPTLAGLTQKGKNIALEKIKNNLELFSDVELILSSPFNRAYETASIFNTYLKKEIIIEDDLHEWLPDKNFKYKIKDLKNLYKDYKLNNGIGINKDWETDEEVKERFFNVVKKYNEYNKIAIFAHSRLFKIICTELKNIDYCDINIINI